MEPENELSPAVASLVQEVAVAVDRLLNRGEGSVIDLRALSFLTDEDREELHALLGEGEVAATVEAVGPTEVVETAYPGVWWVTYWNTDGEVLAERIEVARTPDILVTQETDMRDGLGRLLALLPAPEDEGQEGPAIRWQAD